MSVTEEKPIEEKKSLSFVEQLVEQDLAEGKNGGRIQTRFPPEPNGYLHIGHAKAICMDFGVAEKYNGVCNLRFDDTNPTKENNEYVENILNDISWLGFKWGNIYYASDYFDKLWEFAIWMIKNGYAYIDEQTAEQIAEQKGTPTTPGTNSPYRDRPVEENLELFNKMNTPEAVEGSMVLRAKLDMANPNMHFRDPIIYRIIHTPHHRTGTKWNAYPMYDFAHGQSDFFEGVTHSICTLEFVPHRPLYDKFIDFLKEMRGETENIHDFRPRQIEFNRLNLTYTMMSKRKLLALVNEGVVSGWDDPRMPTLSGMRAADTRLSQYASLSTQSAIPSSMHSTTWLCLRLPFATTSTSAHCAFRLCSTRLSSLSPTIPRAKPKRWKLSTILRTRLTAHTPLPSRRTFGLSATTSWRTLRRSSSV